MVDIDLKKILAEERKPKFSPIDSDFYSNAHAYLAELEEERNRTEPESMKRTILEDELNAAKVNFESIVELRMAKIIKAASTKKSQKSKEKHEPENMTSEEGDLYKALFTTMDTWKGQRLNRQKTAENVPQIRSDTSYVPNTSHVPNTSNVLKMSMKDYILVRVLKDIPTFVGIDERNYTLAKEDVATVPAVNAKALISKNAAVQIGARM